MSSVDPYAARNWCLEARKILKMGKRGDLKSRAEKVLKQIRELEAEHFHGRLPKTVVDGFTKDFGKLAEQLKEAAEANKPQEVQRLSNKLSELKKQLAVELSNSTEQSAKERANAANKLRARQISNIPDEIKHLRQQTAKLSETYEKIEAIDSGKWVETLLEIDGLEARKDHDGALKLIHELQHELDEAPEIAKAWKDFETVHKQAEDELDKLAMLTDTKDDFDRIKKHNLDDARDLALEHKFGAAMKLLGQVKGLVGAVERTVIETQRAKVRYESARKQIVEGDYQAMLDAPVFGLSNEARQQAQAGFRALPAAPKTLQDYQNGLAAVVELTKRVAEFQKQQDIALKNVRYLLERRNLQNGELKDVPRKALLLGLEKLHNDVLKAIKDLPDSVTTADGLDPALDKLKTAKELAVKFHEAAGRNLEDLKKTLERLDPAIEKAIKNEQTDFFKRLGKRLKEGRKSALDKLKRTDFGVAQQKVALVQGYLAKFEAVAEAYEKHLVERKSVQDGVVKLALELELTGPLAGARTKGLDRIKQEIEALADHGKIPPANRRIEDWKAQAQGWLDSHGTAKDAYEALESDPTSDENMAKLIKLADPDQTPGGRRIFDDLVASLGDKATKKNMTAIMKARFGIELNLQKFEYKLKSGSTEWETDEKGNLKKFVKPDDHETRAGRDPNKVSKSMSRVYELLSASPDKYTSKNPSLAKIVRIGGSDNTTPSVKKAIVEGGSYNRTEKRIKLTCGRIKDSRTKKFDSEMPEAESSCKPTPSVKANVFDWTSQHELAHAMDDSDRFMASRLDDLQFGGWQDHGTNPGPVALAAQGQFVVGSHSFDVEKIKELLTGAANKTLAAFPAPAAPDLSIEEAWKRQWGELLKWCNAIREAKKPWALGVKDIDGRIYHESYEGKWVSYAKSARKQGVTGYQFRAPGEWFSELYAAYATEKMNAAHPARAWLDEF